MKDGMKIYTIRAHHAMCLAYFEGKGYSDGFTARMRQVKQALQTNPPVAVVQQTDVLCACCPHNQAGRCSTAEKTKRYDKEVLRLCGLKAQAVLPWKILERRVQEQILQAGKRKSICSDCEWNALCSAKEQTG